MKSQLRAETVVQTLEQYLGARENFILHSGPLGQMKTARGFLVIALEMGVNLDRLNARVEKLEAAVREINPGLNI